MEARSRCSGISAAAGSTSQFFLCLQSPDCISFLLLLLLGLCLLTPFRFHMQVDDRRHTSPITINMTFLCMPAVSSWARYILVFRLLSFHGRQGGRFIAAFSFLDNFFVLDIPPCVFCVFGCSLSWYHPWQSQFIASPFGQRHQRDNSATAPEAGGKNNPASSSFCGSRLVLLDNLVSYREYLMDSLVADIFVHIDTA